MKDIIEMLKVRDKLQKRVLDLIGYGSDDNSPIEKFEGSWSQVDDELYLLDGDHPKAWEEGDYYTYTISSYSAKGEKLYVGEEDGFTFIMAYPEDCCYDETTIFMLDNNKNVNTIQGS